MSKKRFTYLLASTDIIAFHLFIWGLLFLRPSLRASYDLGTMGYFLPTLVTILLVGLLALFRQYRYKGRDMFMRQFMSAFNVVILGFLLVVVISFDLGGVITTRRGDMVLFLLALLLATGASRVVAYLWMGLRPDFSLKRQIIIKSPNAKKIEQSKPLILTDTLSVEDIKNQIDESPFDFAVMTDDKGYFAGTVTDGDIIEAAMNHNGNSRINDIIDRTYPVARESLSPGQLHQMMLERNLRFLPLLSNDGRPSRVVLLSDLDEKYHQPRLRGKTRRVLIIGGAGYIGSVMTRYLLKRGYQVSVLDNLMFGYDGLRDLDNHPAYRFYEGDARNVQDLLTAMEDVDCVVHLAAIVGDPACALDPRATIDINYEASKILVDACLHKKVDRLLFASSCSVYGASENGELLTEESPLNPVSLYAETRLRSEEAILKQAEPPLAVTMFRLATVFGFSYRPRFDLVVNILTARALIDGEISIFGGSQWRPNVHVLDVVRGFVAAIEAPKEKVDRQVFNLGSEGQNYRISQLGELVKEQLPNTIIKKIEAEMDRRDYRVSFDKIEKALGYKAGVTVSDGIREIIDAYHHKKFIHYSEDRYSNFKLLGG